MMDAKPGGANLTRKVMSRANMLRTTLLGAAAGFVGAEFLTPGGLVAAAASGNENNVVLQWNSATLQAIRNVHPGPPMTARALAVVHTCLYDAWAIYDPVAAGTQPSNGLRPRGSRSLAAKSQSVSFAAYRALVDLFPTEHALFDGVMARLEYDPADISMDSSPAGVGNLCAHAVLTFRHGDKSNQLGDLHWPPYSDWTGYQPINPPEPAAVVDPNRWQPLRVSNGSGGFVSQTYIGPHWGLVTPFALTSGSQFRPGRPATTPFGLGTTPSAAYATEVQEILQYSAGLTDTQKMIAEYWKDGPRSEQPPGHWCLFGQYVSARDHHDLDDDVRMFFALSNALLDAGITAWDSKRAYDSVRPITAVHWLLGDQTVMAWGGPCAGTEQIAAASWSPYQPATIVTPPFPEYISGHSTFSAAAAEVLRSFTGSDRFGASATMAAHSSAVEPCTPAQPVSLPWATFSAAADQAGLSRRYGGIHFSDGDLAGRSAGRKVGVQVWEKARDYFNGRRP
jgi:hypothetical protein